MIAKKRVRRGFLGIIVVMGFYGASLRVEGIRSSLEIVGSRLFFMGMALQQEILAPFQGWSKYGSSVSALHERIDRLQKERDDLWEERIKREGTATFSLDTQEIRSYAQRYEYEGSLILAQCMVKEITPDQHVMIVDKGARHGVTTSMVAVYKNMLLGRVSDVQELHSKVTLITDRRCKITAFCVKTRAAGIVEGVNKEDEVSLSYISHLSEVEEGDTVLSSGQGLIFPYGFALGSIEHCEIDGLYHKISIKPCKNTASIDFCYLFEKGTVSALDSTRETDEAQEA